MNKMLRAKMKGVPEEQQDKMIEIINKNPDLFQKIGAEVEQLMKQGKDQASASMEVMRKYQSELKRVF
jgi:2-oxo-4-hydroxy-4-carboxy--5-ureidoimidazoline (OHCU) decarboxylase